MDKFGKVGVDAVNKVITDVNKTIKNTKNKTILLKPSQGLLTVDISIEKKKKILVDEMYNSIIKTFSIDIGKVTDTGILKNNVKVIRKIIKKIININHYLATTFISELNDKKIVTDVKLFSEAPIKINKKEIRSLEYTVYTLIEKIIVLDNKLLDEARKSEKRNTSVKKDRVMNLKGILGRQLELLYHLDAKLPPPSKIDMDLIQNPHLSYWTAGVLALLAAFKNEHKNEISVLKELKKNSVVKAKLNTKIKHIIKEKSEILRLKEGRILMMDRIKKMDSDWKRCINDWSAVAGL
ncbi:MAG: hypothetical protein ABIC04_00265 [Nanoarchaeota archaeon]